MSECFAFSSSMTGSTNSGPLQPPKDSSPLVALPLPFERYSTAEAYPRKPGRKMTLTPPNGQPIQLTPLWEHVVRTRRFPTEVDTRLTFLEISERLRDPEWEVRQHALRVLIDVIPTLNSDIVDKVMQPVVPELINNLGHPAPAVRKGALDALRVFLVHCRDREETVKKILEDGLNRAETRDPFQTNVTTGVILSAPSLLFPSSSSPSPASQLIKDTTIALASRLAQVPHQEAVLKSLMKIRDAVGDEKFENYLADYDNKLTRNIEILSKIYNVKPCRKNQRKISADGKNSTKREKDLDRKWESDSDTSGIAEEEEEGNNATMPPGRVVLETEIKFNEETAITMTILEEKEEESEKEQDEESGTDVRNEADVTDVKESSLDRRKTPRRVHFGGEIVKLRTPDSEDTESIEATPKTRIPLPVSPATKMPERPRRASSQPCSPRREKRTPKRTSRSVSSSPRREVYTHNAELSPKKSILTRTNSPVIAVKSAEQTVSKRRKNSARQDDKENDKRGTGNEASEGKESVECFEAFRKIEELQKPALGSTELIENISAGKNPNVRSEKHEGGKEESLPEKSNRKADAESGKDTLIKMSVDGKSENCDSRIEEKTGVKDSLRGQSSEETLSKRSIRNEVETKVKSLLEDNSTIREKKVIEDKGSRRSSIGTKANDFKDSRIKNDSEGNVVTNDRIERLVEDDSKIDNKVITESFQTSSSKIDKPPLKKSESAREILVNESEFSIIPKESGAANSKRDNDLIRNLRNSASEHASGDDRDKRSESAIEKNVNVPAEVERKLGEPSWEELGLVEEEVLEDLHNKDDWRARVRGFERVASALRTSSALIAIEGRLGSLLHAVLGCERSCRVAAAGLAVAKVVVAGVNEEALKKRLPQLAWGLARQGGPNAAQLARIAMLRLRPALLLEQLLQPQCLNARKAKTRENALQLLIFSLVTFPSTEFKVEIVANKVAKMVGDRRRRVRQAALDTLAVLAQIYEPEEVLAAGKRAAEGRHDGEAMIAAIRSRLARKSLPLVSADGLVVYGLQISPTVQIATGPDVDWIVAGSGSVSPGTGRTRGQVITTTPEKGRIPPRNSNAKNRDSPWIDRPNFVALGVGMRSRGEHPVAWQIVRTQNQDDSHCDDQLTVHESRSANTEIRSGKNTDSNLRSNDQLRPSAASRDSANYRNIVENNLEHRTNFRTVDVIDKEKETVNKAESRIPVPFARERGTTKSSGRGRSANMELAGANSRRRRDKDSFDSIGSRASNRDDNIGSHSAVSQRKKRFLQENSTSRISGATETLDQSSDISYNNYHTITAAKHYMDGNKGYSDVLEDGSEEYSEIDARSYQKIVEKERHPRKCEAKSRHSRSNSTESKLRPSSTSVRQQTFLMHDMYGSRRDGRFVDDNAFRKLQTAPTPLTRVYADESFERQTGESTDRNVLSRARYYRRTVDASAQKIDEVELVSTDAQTNGHFPAIHDNTPYRRRLRSLSPTQLYHRQQFARMVSNQVHAMSMYDVDKAVNEEEYNERNKQHFLPETTDYHVQAINTPEPRFEVDNGDRVLSKSTSSSSSDLSRDHRQREIEEKVEDKEDYSDSGSSTPQSHDGDAAFDVITRHSSPPGLETVDPYVIGFGQKIEPEPTIASIEDDVDASKDWSSEEDVKLRNRSLPSSGCSQRSVARGKNRNETECSTSDDAEMLEEKIDGRRRRRSVVSVLSNERILTSEIVESEKLLSNCPNDFAENGASPLRSVDGSPKKTEALYSNFDDPDATTISSSRRNSRNSANKLEFDRESEEHRDSSEERIIASILHDESCSFQSLEAIQSRRESLAADSPTIIIASRPHSNEALDLIENINVTNRLDDVDNARRFVDESEVNEMFEDGQSKDSASETNAEPGILKIETRPAEPINPPKRSLSKVPRGKFRTSITKASPEKPVKPKSAVQQCFNQLESKDWEITIKGLKALSQIAKQHPEQLDVCAAGTIGRLLGRHVKNLRSQVARAACMAAGDVFSSQIRGIDQDIDDIAGPLLHRTADTNRFLRADSNAALDRMVEHLPPHKTIGIIVSRGAKHQNAIVRAATGRLLTEIVERVGAEHTMILPKDARDKLLNAAAKLLIDGNLDARNYAKKIFRRLTGCDGFRKALTDAVPEATLRHIDKTLRTL